MKNRIINHVKNNRLYYMIAFSLLIITLLTSTVTYSNTDFVLNFPTNSLFGTISYVLIFVLGIFGIFLFRNANDEKVPLEKKFLIIAIPIGLLYCLVIPLGKAPDEDDHAKKAAAISHGNFFSIADANGNATDMLNAKIHELVSRSTDSYENAWARLTAPETEEKIEMSYNTQALYAPICHTPQAFGMFIARVLGGGISVQCYAARLTNFAVAIFLIYKAIKFIPYKKHLLLFIAMLPLTFNQITTMTADALTISMCLFYISYILYLKYDEKVSKINIKEMFVLIISSIVLSLCKIVYLPLCMLLFILPKEKFTSLKQKRIFSFSVIFSAIFINLIWLIYCSRFLIEFNAGVNSKEQVIYILTHPLQYFLIFFRTVNVFFQALILGLCGDSLISYTVQASPIFILPCFFIITALFFINEEKTKINFDLPTRIIFLLVFIAIIALIYTSLYVQWTPLKQPLILGIQSRYFLPILLLTAVFFDNKKIIIKEKLNRFLLLFSLFINLNVITCTIYTYLIGNSINIYVK